MLHRKLPCCLPVFLAVWRGQTETEAALVDLKGLATPAVIVHLPAILLDFYELDWILTGRTIAGNDLSLWC